MKPAMARKLRRDQKRLEFLLRDCDCTVTIPPEDYGEDASEEQVIDLVSRRDIDKAMRKIKGDQR